MTWVLVAAGAAVGAPLRYLVDRAVTARWPGPFPWGTFAVNQAGCLLLGMLTGAAGALPVEAAPLLHVGLCGALTTYSAFGYEIARLATRGRRLLAGTYALASVSVGLAGMAAGRLAGEWLAARR